MHADNEDERGVEGLGCVAAGATGPRPQGKMVSLALWMYVVISIE